MEMLDKTMGNSDALKLPKCVVERLEWISKVIKDDGIKPIGSVEMVLAYEPKKNKEAFEFGSSHDWLPVTNEFIEWRQQATRTAELLIIGALFFVPYEVESE